MAAGTFTLYNAGKLNLLDGDIEFDADTIVGVLVTSGYTPAATHSTYADISANECADGDYAPVVLSSKTVTEGSGTVTVDAADVDYGSAVTITAKYIALVRRAGGSLVSGDLLLGYMDLDTGGGSVSSTTGNFIVRWNASGIFTAA